MDLTLYHLKSCDTCRKAIKALTQAGHDLTLIDVRADGVTPADLAAIETVIGWQKLLNTRSTTWRGLNETDKADMDSAKALSLMEQHPTLIKRPVIKGKTITAGWTIHEQGLYL